MTFKRILPVLLIICLFVGLLPAAAFAAETILVAEWWIGDGSHMFEYGASDKTRDAFESAWNKAMEAADGDHSKMMHFKLHTDWVAKSNGDFADYWVDSGAGFNYWTIYIPDGAQVTLDLNGCIINRRLTSGKANGEVIYVDEDATLIIEDSTPNSYHRGTVNNEGLWREGSGIYELHGGIITGGYSDNGAGGIHMKEDSHVVLKGGTIAGNASTEGGTLNMGGGGGVQVEGDDALLEMYEGAAIMYNAATSNDGGGVEVWNGAFVMHGGEISYNRAADDGGGVHTFEDDGTAFTMYGGEISDNTATCGGGVYIDSSVLIEHGFIRYNTASSRGGGIYFNDDDSPIVNSVYLSYNTAYEGGGVYINTDDVEMHNTEFSENTAVRGGAVYCDNEAAKFTNCNLFDNKATDVGGGFYLYDEDVVIDGGFFSGNEAGQGCAVYIADSSVFSCAYQISNVISWDGESNGTAGIYLGTKNKLALSGDVKIGFEDCVGLYVAQDATISAEGVSADSEVWLDSDAKSGIISTDRGSHNVLGFRYTDGEHGLLWINDPYNGDYRKIKIVSAEEVEEQITTETVPTGILETLDYSVEDKQYALLKGTYTYSSCNDSTRDNDAIFYYSDGYFDRAPDEYDSHLSTMSMNLAMSGFYSSRGQDGTSYYQEGQRYIYMSETDYSNRHASVRQLLSDIGVSDENIYVNDDYVICPTPDTIGVAVGQKQLCYADGTETGYTLVPIVIRSANYEQEWVSNVTLGDGSENGGEAKGFSTAADMAMEVVEGYIADYGLTEKVAAGKVKFWVVGYSRGGATANLLSKRLTDKYSDPANGGSKVFGYCFEAPKGGVDKAVVNAEHTYNGEYHNIHNCINIGDLVPSVGPWQMGFHRYGVDHYVPGDPLAGTVTASESQATMDSSYTRQNGESFTRVTTYADNSPYYVKPVDTYVKNHDDPDLEKYYPQRAKAVAQLRSVCPDMVLDDCFYTAELSYLRFFFSDLVKKAGDEDDIPRMDQWIEDFVSDLLKATNMTRTNFATKPVVIENVLGDKIGGLTFQQATQNAIGLVFALPADKMEALTDRFSHFSKYVSALTYADLATLYINAIGHWDAITETERFGHIANLWNEVRRFKLDEIFSEEEYDALEDAWPTLADVLLRFVSKDYEYQMVQGVDDTQAHLGTLLYNIGRIGANHYPEINLAWLRSYDSFYTTDIPGTETGVSTHIVREQPTAAEAPRAYIGETELVSDAEEITLEGTQTLLLSTEADGDAIYYTVSEDGAEDDTLHIYRDGIELAEDLEGTSYTVTTYAMQYGAKSASKTYRVKIEASGPVLPPLKIKSASLHIAEDINMIYAAEVPDGYTDPYMVFTLNGEDHTVDTYTVNSKGQYCFELTAITPQCMGDNISATLYAKAGRKTRSVTKAEYSVRAYCANMLAKTDDSLFVTLLSDLLTYGAAAQNYTGYKTDSLVTDGLDLTPTPTPRLAGLTEEFVGTADPNTYWTSASLTLRNNVDMNLFFETDDLEGLSVVLEINGRTETFTDITPAFGEQPGYQITYHGILATEFGLPVSASFYRNGVKIGNTLKYTVNAYACSKQYDSDKTLAAMVLALVNYGSTANYYYFARYLQQ